MAEDKPNKDFDVPWAQNLRHRPDPNRVKPSPGTPGEGLGEGPHPGTPSEYREREQSEDGEHSYYDVPILKQPVWKWQIASYFFLGGLSAGAYVLSRAAERAGGRRFSDLSRIGSYVAFASILPAPPLLIADLGDPKRFHHMLRVWKPGTPMNFGTWSLVAYSGMATYEVVRQYLVSKESARIPPARRGKLLKVMNNGVLMALHDAAGVPLSLIVAGYTGVLISCTSNPLWCKNPWIGPLFSASAISTGAEAISLALDCTQFVGWASPTSVREAASESPSHAVLRNVDTLAHVAEVFCMKGFMKFAGEKARPLREGKMSKHHQFARNGIIASEVLKRLPVGRHLRKPVRMLASAMGLAAGFSLRWSMVYGGHEAAADPHLSREATGTATAPRRARSYSRDWEIAGESRKPPKPAYGR